MKGLTLNGLGKKDEAYDLVKKGLTKDLRSHVCWHVYGLLQRAHKKYDEAIKCYRNALKWDKENLHILRDLSMLQVHMRDFEGYRETRHTLLQLKPVQRAPWIGYAIANHLVKEYTVAYKVLEEFGKTQQSSELQYEHSELLLYQTEILMEAGKYSEALRHLQSNQDKIMDKLALQEYKGELALLLHDAETAERIFTELIFRNPENHKYYGKLEEIIKPETETERLQIYQAVLEHFPRADTPKFLPLLFVTGDLFRQMVDKQMRSQLRRGVPPLYVSLKPLYKDPKKVEAIGDIVRGYLSSLEECQKFDPSDEEEESPSTLLWTRFLYAQHLDGIGQYEQSLQILDQALSHTPTLIELHVAKAKTLKHMGDMRGAVECMDEAQSLDTADRFINCKCAAYMIRNDLITEAEDIASKFTRENVSVEEYLKEMQCMWYEIECASAHAANNRYGDALKKCHEIDKHFSEIIEDQFDFHQYCMRKMTLRAYVKMLKLEDCLRSHKFYFQAARIAIKVYVHLHDEPHQADNGNDRELEAKLSSSELKKLKNKQRRQQRKKAAEAEKKKLEQEKNNKNRNSHKKQKGDDATEAKKEDEFLPETLLATTEPIEEARKFLLPLELHCSDQFETHYFAYQIAERRNKVLLMLRSILRCEKVVDDTTRPLLHECKVRFFNKVHNSSEMSDQVADVVNSQRKQLFGDVETPEEFNFSFMKQYPNSLPHVFSGCKAMYHLDPSKKELALDTLLSMSLETAEGVSLKLCEEIFKAIQGKLAFGVVPKDAVLAFKSTCAKTFARANKFQPELSKTEVAVGNNNKSSSSPNNQSNNNSTNTEPALCNGKPEANHTGDEESTATHESKLPNGFVNATSALIEDHCSHGV